MGVQWILWVAERVSQLDGARSFVISPPAVVLPIMALGALTIVLWQGRGRWIGGVPVLAACLLWGQADRPELLIAEGGTLVGILTAEGRALSKPRGSGFVARTWLENDGDAADQPAAAARWFDTQSGIARMQLAGWEVLHITQKRAAAGAVRCRPDQIVIGAYELNPKGGCQVFDAARSEGDGKPVLAMTGRYMGHASSAATGCGI